MTNYSVPPGYRRQNPLRRPQLEPFTGVIDRILESDLSVPRKQRHTAKRIFERLRDEYGFGGQYTIGQASAAGAPPALIVQQGSRQFWKPRPPGKAPRPA